MPTQCCAMGCRNNGHHFFPKDLELRHQWEIAVRRKNFKAKSHTRLCPDHFRDEDYVKEGFFSGLKLERKILKKGAIPSQFVWNEKVMMKYEQRRKRQEKRAKRQQKLITSVMPEDTIYNDMCIDTINTEMTEIPIEFVNTDKLEYQPIEDIKSEIPEHPKDLICSSDEIKTRCSESVTSCAVAKIVNDVASKVKVTTSTSLDFPDLLSSSTRHVGTQKNYQFFCIGTFMKNKKAMNFYTGFESYEKFQFAFSTLCPEAHSLKYMLSQVLLLSVEDQFLLTLIKLRRNHLDFELAMLFDISPGTVSNVFVTWLNFMHQKWSALISKPRKDLVETYIPEECTYPTTQEDDESASEDTDMDALNTFNNHRIFAVDGVTLLKSKRKTFRFLKMQKRGKYFNLMTRARLVCKMLCNFTEGKV